MRVAVIYKFIGMKFEFGNNVFNLCIEGMCLETEGYPENAAVLYRQAWDSAVSSTEKFTAAHYVAKHQKSLCQKLMWDKLALDLAKQIDHDDVKEIYPLLHLNVAECYRNLKNVLDAFKHYKAACDFIMYLPENPYGGMIKNNILSGLRAINPEEADNWEWLENRFL